MNDTFGSAEQLLRERDAARAQRDALSEVLRTIAASPDDPQPVFELIARRALELCSASGVVVHEFDGERLRPCAMVGYEPDREALFRAGFPRPAGRDTVPGRVVLAGEVVEIADVRNDPELFSAVRALGTRTTIGVPITSHGRVQGVICPTRFTVQLFDDGEIALLQSFAEQAAIAIGNARARREERAALERQTATAEILRAINAHPGQLEPVFETILEQAHALCGVAIGALVLFENGMARAVTTRGYADRHAAANRQPRRPTSYERQVVEGGERMSHVHDLLAIDPASDGGLAQRMAEVSGARTALALPFRKEAEVLGYFSAFRTEPRPFTESEIELLESFAAQAAIAIGNARLLTGQREALERQTATAEILRAINAHPGQLEPVFETILEKAHALCDVAIGSLVLYENGLLRRVAARGYVDRYPAANRRPRPPTSYERLVVEGGERMAHFHDLLAIDPATDGGLARRTSEVTGGRAVLALPFRKEAEVLGYFSAFRTDPRPFTEPEIELLESFAAQAAIAIVNARLLTEQREALARQTATAEVLAVVNANPGNLAPVFETILAKAHLLCGAEVGALGLFDGTMFRKVARHGYAGTTDDVLSRPYPVQSQHAPLLRGETIHVPDVQAVAWGDDGRDFIANTGLCTWLEVPMFKDGTLIGTISGWRREARAFSPQEVALLEGFAAQAVIAIENARLLDELRGRTEELAGRNHAFEVQVAHQAATIDVLKTMSSATSDTQPVFDTIIRRALDLCGGKFGAIYEIDGETVALRVMSGWDEGQTKDYAKLFPRPYGHEWRMDRAMRSGNVDVVRDLKQDISQRHAAIRALHFSNQLTVPLMRDGVAIGCIAIASQSEDSFGATHVDLLRTFAEQATIAIGSAATFRALQHRTAELDARNHAFAEQVAHQAATIDVLKAMSASPGDAQPVFELIAHQVGILADIGVVVVYEYDGELIHVRGLFGSEQAIAPETIPPYLATWPRPPTPDSYVGRAILEARSVHVPDVQGDPNFPESVRSQGFLEQLSVPMMHDGGVVGAITICSWDTKPMRPSQIELTHAFAEQGAIALASARTFHALQERTAQLDARNQAFAEQVAHQAATIEVLKAMSASPGDPQPVFDLIAQQVRVLTRTGLVGVFEYDGELVHMRSHFGSEGMVEPRARQAYIDSWPRHPTLDMGGNCLAILEGRSVHVPDVQGDSTVPALVRALGYREALSVPMLRDGRAVGAIAICSWDTEPMRPSQIELTHAFAEQGAIALASARTFHALQQRTAELADSLEMQTATADVLKVISRSAFDLDTVLDTLTRSAATLCGADTGNLRIRDGEGFRLGASFGFAAEGNDYLRTVPLKPGRGSISARVAQSLAVEMLGDVRADAEMDPALLRVTPNRAVLGVPLLRDGVLEGVFVLGRTKPGLFTQRQVEVVQTFADQAVIAIQNARLFAEVNARTRDLSETLEQQRAAADILNVISTSVADPQPVFEKILESCQRLFFGDELDVLLVDEQGMLQVAAYVGKAADVILPTFPAPWEKTPVAPALRGLKVVQYADVINNPDTPRVLRRVAEIVGYHSVAFAPMVWEGRGIGVVGVARSRGAFTGRELEVLQGFADQAVIAIQNARMFLRVRSARDSAEAALQDLRAAQDRLVQTEKLASLGQLTAGIAHEIKNPLNFVNNFSSLSVELLDELQEVLAPAPIEANARDEIDELVGMLKGNLEKVVTHGKRADGIVRNMLLHSRESGGEQREVDFNATVEEALNLAYHGARAEKPGFNITLVRNFDSAIGMVELFPQEFTRVLLNLIGNGFYAAGRRKADAPDAGFEPMLSIATETRADAVAVRVRDNGTGIPEHVKARLFEPFFTTKPAGEGTGLGLSLSHDIVVKQHGGSIAVESVPGQFTEFTVTIPHRLPGTAA